MDVYSGFIHNGKTCKQPRCPSIGEWINKLWYILTMECYSLFNNTLLSNEYYSKEFIHYSNELSSHEKTRRNLKRILLSERSNLKSYIMYNSNYMIFWKRLWRQLKDQWLPGAYFLMVLSSLWFAHLSNA